MTRDEAFKHQLMLTFKDEFQGYIASFNQGFVALEREPTEETRAPLVAELFRAAHSMKGAASVVGLDQIQIMAHRLEDVLAALRDGKLQPSSRLIDQLFYAVDELEAGMEAKLDGRELAQKRVDNVLQELDAALHTQQASVGPKADVTEDQVAENRGQATESPVLSQPEMVPNAAEPLTETTVRVSVAKLDKLLEGVGELAMQRDRFERTLTELRDMQSLITQRRKSERTARRRHATRQHGRTGASGNDELVGTIADRLDHSVRRYARDAENISLLADSLLDAVLQARMVPLARLFDSFPRVVRDLARDSGKHINFRVEGTDIEVDRRVLELARDPLTHLVRNAVDHGIETPTERQSIGKPEHGTIVLRGMQEGNVIVLEIQDNGRGIDPDQVRRAAVARGIISIQEAERLGDTEATDLIFRSGLSTADQVTLRSGRGVGLDVVRQNIETLQGAVDVRTHLGEGSTFTLRVPLTLATAQVVLVLVSGRHFAIPTTGVEHIAHVPRKDIRVMEGRPIIVVDGEPLQLISLGDALGLTAGERTTGQDDTIAVVVVGAAEKRLAMQVDAFLSTQEVIVKSLGPQLRRVPNVSAATVLGDGQLAIILNVADLIKGARTGAVQSTVEVEPVTAAPRRHRILVVDDSITSRTLERSILQTAGYDVVVAADGAEAWSLIQTESLDATVADVDMPEMDGLELTAKIKGDARYKAMPVILVTSMASRHDQIRGLEAGADAYITKGSFDQTVLLETIERLI